MALVEQTFSWMTWHFHPDVTLGVLALEGLYLLGVGLLRRRYRWAPETPRRQVVLFTLGVLVMYASLTGPIHELADNYLFSAHMVQHLLISLVVPPLLLAGLPGGLVRPLVRLPLVYRTARVLIHPVPAFALFSGVLALWHLPALYEWALRVHGAHVFQHLLLMATAVLMWWPLLSPVPELPRASYPVQMVYLFLLSLAPGFVGAAITFSSRVLYPFYQEAPRLWGIAPLVDQQIGGLIMKLVGGFAFLGILAVVFLRWYSREEGGKGEHVVHRNGHQSGSPAATRLFKR
ncbi:MAG: cytochrome c oxidase assembly protein [Chloroflexi bacterium]|nr:cytochrome c oxidase assembly protein [Chloroflexota bacterium]